MAIWGPSKLGALFTKTDAWQLSLEGLKLTLTHQGKRTTFHASKNRLSVKPGLFWSSVEIKRNEGPDVVLDGILNSLAANMKELIDRAHDALVLETERRKLLETLDALLAPIIAWADDVDLSFQEHVLGSRWITHQTLEAWHTSKPNTEHKELALLVKEPYVAQAFRAKDQKTHNAITLLQSDIKQKARSQNEALLKSERSVYKAYFDTVEKSPLTDEQTRAVICFDNRVLTIASAGSGKTSTMVAKAGYAIKRGVTRADKILLLAFNKDAADELQERVIARLKPLGLPAELVVARTFHGFGSDVIARATGKKPTPAPWVTSKRDVEHLAKLIDDLKDNDKAFRVKWDLFRVVFSRDLPKFGKEEESPEDWDPKTNNSGFRTLRNEVVKSQGERLIADWLFYNGVNYVYEREYEHETATQDYRQYFPDFYYPDVGLYHEHFALDKSGNAPPEFKGYMEGVKWKRALHKRHQTALIETTSAQLRNGYAFDILENELSKRGIELDPNPDRPAIGRTPIEHEDLVKVFRTFLTHAKSNRLTHEELEKRLSANAANSFALRHGMFLDLFKSVRKAWEDSLKAHRVIDFEDMLNSASEYLEAGSYQSPFELVMVDEFQDASWARARMARALVKEAGRFLFAVGDDWQSINRFAGSDISVMTSFERWFGEGETVKLERTFRCPQSICNISSNFVRKNTAQIDKKVESNRPEFVPSLQVFQAKSNDGITSGINKVLSQLCKDIVAGRIPPAYKGKIKVFVLGRYKKDENLIPEGWQEDYGKHFDLEFSTVHGSKGLEADYVIIPRMVNNRYSFPSTIEDDPVLQLAMPSGEEYLFAEERRLFYVALTRARRSITIFTVEHAVSPFVIELVNDLKLEILDIDGKKSKTVPCPKCKVGTLKEKPGKNGPFIGCTRFPKCRHSENLPDVKRKA